MYFWDWYDSPSYIIIFPGTQERKMSHYAALYSIVFMMGFVYLFDVQHQRHRLCRLFDSVRLMTPQELHLIRKIQSAGEEA